MLVSYMVLTYGSMHFKFSAFIGMILIIFLGGKAWPESWSDRLGLKIPRRAALISIISLPFIILISHLMVLKISLNHNISYISWFSDFSTSKYLQNFAQAFNEEMVLGALLLYFIKKSFVKIHPLFIAMGVAIMFALFHYIFFSWMVILPIYSGKLTLPTLMTLFLVGMLRNTLILKNSHIAYAWTLHFGFNLVLLRGTFFDPQRDMLLNQPESFNLILGSPIMLLTGILMFIFSLFLYRRDLKFLSK